MLHPTIDELTQGKFNRYELALATARCARLITDEYVRQHDVAERSQTGNKETDRPINTMIDRELRDEKAVKVAIKRIANGDFLIDENAADYEPIDLAAEHEAAMQARYPIFPDDDEDEEDEEEDELFTEAERDEAEAADREETAATEAADAAQAAEEAAAEAPAEKDDAPKSKPARAKAARKGAATGSAAGGEDGAAEADAAQAAGDAAADENSEGAERS